MSSRPCAKHLTPNCSSELLIGQTGSWAGPRCKREQYTKQDGAQKEHVKKYRLMTTIFTFHCPPPLILPSDTPPPQLHQKSCFTCMRRAQWSCDERGRNIWQRDRGLEHTPMVPPDHSHNSTPRPIPLRTHSPPPPPLCSATLVLQP